MATPKRGPRSFDAVAVGNRETDAWAAYYRHEWRTFLVAAVGMVREGFGMSWPRTLLGAWHVLRANQHWAPYPRNDPDAARASMRRFYALVARSGSAMAIDPVRASELEVEWWRVHREHQHDPAVSADSLVEALVNLYAYVYSAPPESMYDAARHRVEAMDLSDRWVDSGCEIDDPLLAAERRALVSSYTSLRAAVS
jgi:hypothetical protein